MLQHLGYVRNKVFSKATGEHFNLPSHDKNNMKFTIIEKVRSQDPLFGREREKLHTRNLNTFYEGIIIRGFSFVSHVGWNVVPAII